MVQNVDNIQYVNQGVGNLNLQSGNWSYAVQAYEGMKQVADNVQQAVIYASMQDMFKDQTFAHSANSMANDFVKEGIDTLKDRSDVKKLKVDDINEIVSDLHAKEMKNNPQYSMKLDELDKKQQQEFLEGNKLAIVNSMRHNDYTSILKRGDEIINNMHNNEMLQGYGKDGNYNVNYSKDAKIKVIDNYINNLQQSRKGTIYAINDDTRIGIKTALIDKITQEKENEINRKLNIKKQKMLGNNYDKNKSDQDNKIQKTLGISNIHKTSDKIEYALSEGVVKNISLYGIGTAGGVKTVQRTNRLSGMIVAYYNGNDVSKELADGYSALGRYVDGLDVISINDGNTNKLYNAQKKLKKVNKKIIEENKNILPALIKINNIFNANPNLIKQYQKDSVINVSAGVTRDISLAKEIYNDKWRNYMIDSIDRYDGLNKDDKKYAKQIINALYK